VSIGIPRDVGARVRKLKAPGLIGPQRRVCAHVGADPGASAGRCRRLRAPAPE